MDAVHFIMMKAPQPLNPMQEKGCLTNDMILILLTCLNSIKRLDIVQYVTKCMQQLNWSVVGDLQVLEGEEW